MSTALMKITAKAKQIRKAHPSIQWTSAIKQASATLRREGKIGSTKKVSRSAPKKRTRKKKPAKKLRQTGTSNKFYDEQRSAKAPGKRKSRTGRTYHENRKNRSDMPGSLTGVSSSRLMGAVREQLKSTLGRLYVQRDMSKLKRDKKKYQKQITETKRKITKYK